ncbi:MAG: lysoplasmalogenase [Lachnospiraceae bacterium]|nr:lysoplasmalogenase [Lachnospiraceae bacterium]
MNHLVFIPGMILALMGVVFAVLFTQEGIRFGKPTLKAVFLKTAASTSFLMMAMLSIFGLPILTVNPELAAPEVLTPNHCYLFFVEAGMVLGLLGDVWLALKNFSRKSKETYTLAGFICFGFAHIFYLIGLIAFYGDPTKPFFVIWPIALGMFLGAVVGVFGGRVGLRFGHFKKVVILYGSMVASMALMGGSLAFMYNFQLKTLNFMFVGGFCFLISDLILAGTYFGHGKYKARYVIGNNLFYFGALALIATSVYFL